MSFVKHIILIICLFINIVFLPGNSSAGNTDSLFRRLQNSDQKQKIEIYQQLCREYLFVSPDSCLKYGNKLIELTEQTGNYEALSQVNKKIGYLFYRLGDYNSSLKYLEAAKTNSIKCNDSLNLAIVINMIGDSYTQMLRFTNSLEYLMQAEEICNNLSYSKNMEVRVKRLYSIIYTNLGLLYYKIDSIRNSEEYFNQALEYAKDISDSTRISATYSNLGMVYRERKELSKALNMYQNSLIVSENIGNEGYQQAILNNIANLYREINQEDSALFYYKQADSYAKIKNDKYGLSLIYNNIAQVFLLLNTTDSALFYAKMALYYSESISSLDENYKNYKLISDVYKEKGINDSALYYFNIASILKDSVIITERRAEVAEIHTRYQTEKKEEENRILKKNIEIEQNRIRYLFILSFTLLLLGIISVILFYFIRKNISSKRKLAESETKRLEVDLEAQKRELTLGALSLSRNLKLINSMIKELKDLSEHVDGQGEYHLNNIVKKLSTQQSDTIWKEFEKRFSEIHSNFYNSLLQEYPDLTQSEIKLSAFLKMGMNTKEICAITFQSVRAVEAARLRLRKKLNLNKGDNLSLFLQRF